jgi:hypothetical protein
VGAVFGSLFGVALIAGIGFVAYTRPPWIETYIDKVENYFKKDAMPSSYKLQTKTWVENSGGYSADYFNSPLLDGDDFN